MGNRVTQTEDLRAEEKRKSVDAQLKALQSLRPEGPAASIGTSSLKLQQSIAEAGRQAGAGGIATQSQAAEAAQGASADLAQKALAREAQQQQQAQDLGGMKLMQQQTNDSASIGNRQVILDKQIREQQTRFASLSREKTQELHDDVVQFKRDELGRTAWNERQLADYAILQAKTQEELQDFAMLQQQLTDSRVQMTQQAYKVIAQQLEQVQERELQRAKQVWTAEEQAKDIKIKEMLIAAKQAAARKAEDAKRKAAQSGAFSGLIAAGIGVVSVVYPPAGAIAAGAYALYNVAQTQK